MKVVELLKMQREPLKMMSENDVKRDYWKYVPLYEEFHTMRSNGVKYREAVRMLAESYKTGRATVERVLKKLRQEVKEER